MDFNTHPLALPRNLFINRAKRQLASNLPTLCQKESSHIFPESWSIINLWPHIFPHHGGLNLLQSSHKVLNPPHMPRSPPRKLMTSALFPQPWHFNPVCYR